MTARRVRVEPGDDITALHVLVILATILHEDCQGRRMIGVPFMPLYEIKPGHWRYWCPLLGTDGRCTDYENRPNLCAIFEAGSDPLCVMHEPAEHASVMVGEHAPQDPAA